MEQRKATKELADMHHFTSGAVRSTDADSERWDLVPIRGLRRVARTAAEGASKYGEHNWEKGIPISNLLNHGIRHIYLYLLGDTTEDHLGHAAWNILAACDMEESKPECNDIPSRQCDFQKETKDE